MPQLEKSDLNYRHNYSPKAVKGDDPKKTVEDADFFNRHEEYEVLDLINSFKGDEGKDLTKKIRLTIEWMINEKLPSDIHGRKKVKNWIQENYPRLKNQYPH